MIQNDKIIKTKKLVVKSFKAGCYTQYQYSWPEKHDTNLIGSCSVLISALTLAHTYFRVCVRVEQKQTPAGCIKYLAR